MTIRCPTSSPVGGYTFFYRVLMLSVRCSSRLACEGPVRIHVCVCVCVRVCVSRLRTTRPSQHATWKLAAAGGKGRSFFVPARDELVRGMQ